MNDDLGASDPLVDFGTYKFWNMWIYSFCRCQDNIDTLKLLQLSYEYN